MVGEHIKNFSIFLRESFLLNLCKSVTMNKKQGILLGIALVLLFVGIALATSTTLSASSNVIIYAFDQKPAGRDEGNEWVTFYNPSNESVDIGNWVLETADGEKETIAEGTTLYRVHYLIFRDKTKSLAISCPPSEEIRIIVQPTVRTQELSLSHRTASPAHL